MSQGAFTPRIGKRPRPRSTPHHRNVDLPSSDTASILGASSVDDYLSAISGADARLMDEQDEGTGGETDDEAGNDGTDTDDLTGGSLISPEGADVGLPSQRARTAFTGFKDLKLELILLQALDAVRPFGAQHGRKLDAWRSIVQHLKDHDVIEQEAGRPAVFGLVNARVCQAKWNTLSDEYAEHLREMRRTTGANPTLTKRLQLMGAIYDYELSCKEESARKKQKRSHDNARKESNRVNGLALMERSRSGPSRRSPSMPRTTTVQSDDILNPESMSSPAGLTRSSSGCFSGTESDSSISIISSSSVRNPRTPGLRKRAMAEFANETIKTAADAIARQTEYQQKQMELLIQDQAERRAAEQRRMELEVQDKEERRAAEQRRMELEVREKEERREAERRRMEWEENLRREQKLERDESHARFQELLKTQRDVTAATISTISKQNAEASEKLIMAILQALKK
ncbi:hypothetical protein EC957_011099 [Mortierella hygrophila]|uniref:Uncharacterized protein n=1 Tax=Mortierella hygrophila TaxID=979708 RepID=A0A9P6JXK1_9FUNG|nr:hypothetical protein EC957_011099 [Mortierella hygrophila]